MSRYTCYKCQTEHGTNNMVAYCAACYSDARSEFASLREVNIQLAKDAAAEKDRAEKAKDVIVRMRATHNEIAGRNEVLAEDLCRAEAALAKAQEELDDIKSSYADTIKEACDPPAKDDRVHCSCVPALRREVAALTAKLREAEVALSGQTVSCVCGGEDKVAALTSELYKSRNDAAAWKESFTTEHAQVAALTEKLEAAKRLTAPHLQEYALRLEDENRALTEKVAADAAKQAELIEALRAVDERCPEGFDGQDSWTNEAHRKVHSILARYPKAAKEDA